MFGSESSENFWIRQNDSDLYNSDSDCHSALQATVEYCTYPYTNNQLNLAELTNNNLAGLEADSGERAHQVSRGG